MPCAATFVAPTAANALDDGDHRRELFALEPGRRVVLEYDVAEEEPSERLPQTRHFQYVAHAGASRPRSRPGDGVETAAMMGSSGWRTVRSASRPILRGVTGGDDR